MKKLYLLLASAVTMLSASAQISITGGALTYVQNFDNLDTSSLLANASSNLPTGWSIFEYGTSTTRVDQKYVGDYGGSNTGETYSYGTPGSIERALGSIASGSLTSHYGAKFVNNTGGTITGFTVRYRGEQWRLGQAARTNSDSLRFYYSTSATGVSDTTSANYTIDNNLTFTTPNMTAAASGALDGNLTGNYTIKSGIIAAAIPNGGALVIKWVDPNVLGSDDGLAIDSLSVTFTVSGTMPKPYITSLSPANNAVGVLPSSNLTITFDKNVVKGTGNIYVKNRTNQTVQTINASVSNVSVSGKIATISGVNLQSGKVYHVTFDSTVFDTSGFHSLGIYDTTAWKFSTVGVGVNSIANSFDLPIAVVYPCTNGTFTILCGLTQSAVVTVSVYDLSGRRVASSSFNGAKGDNRLILHSAIPTGAYIIRVDNGKQWSDAKATLE